MSKQSSVLVVFFTIQTDTIAPLASCKQLRFVHQIAGSCGHLAPRTQHPTYTPKPVKSAKCPRVQFCKVSRVNFAPRQIQCKVYPGHFAVLQSVPGTLCTYCKVSPGHFAVLQSVPGTLCRFSVFSWIIRNVCRVRGCGGFAADCVGIGL